MKEEPSKADVLIDTYLTIIEKLKKANENNKK